MDTTVMPPGDASAGHRWMPSVLRTLVLAGAAVLVWVVAGHWDRWLGAARHQSSSDAYVTGDLTPLSAKISGYVQTVAVDDFQTVRKGDLIAQIEPSDYQAQLDLAQASLAAAQAALANLANQKDVQRALVRQAEAGIASAAADMTRTRLEAERQRDLLRTKIAGTEQKVEQADADAAKAVAQSQLATAQLAQQKAQLASLDVQEQQLTAQVREGEAQLALARNNLAYTRITAPADGMVGQRQVRPGQFLNVGTQIIGVMALPKVWVVANYKETQMTHVRVGDPATVTVDAFPDLKLHGHVDSWSPGTGSVFTLLPPDNATGNFTKVVQRVPVKIVLDPVPALGTLVRPGMSVVSTIDVDDRK
ncbi:HlyD family secretion protein [Nitrospirillum amazonense]|uniref:Membrane fusion protein (Multidrug efflux system) n=1 Tax=Nitrospirillum amazonense TaxID=28077 RepID=A0A560K390_9PROT|nr:HlyD family secretion protein [Nitrospirillum amazonense]MDG3444249.1 HlyD family secretion protein [Nitrospirillum amazonense]TWB77803.1 membrane fusion protein (multidrug efflux system) [Nitrospirillum amazonense]